MDYNSKYTGEQVEELLDKINGSPEDIAIPTGDYPDMTVGKASQADTATRAINADNATKAVSADKADSADKATTADYATTAGQATTAESATHADSADSATIANSAMKAEYATNAGNAERATIANSAESAKSAASASTAALAINLQNAPELTTSNEQIVVKVGNKTSNPLTVPYAQRADFATDLSGRNEATAEEFTLRPSAGNKSIRDDSATIKRIKGNSIVWNQQLKTIFSPNITADTVTTNGITFIRLSSGGYNISGSNNTSTSALSNNTVPNLELKAGHKYVIIPIGLKKSTISFYGPASGVSSFITADARIITPTNSASVLLRSMVQAGVTDVNETIYCNVHDLTQMFGAGNEPDTVEEFRALFPGNHYEYNPGQLVSMTANGLFTNGFNQWDEEWVNGYYRIYADSGVGNDGGFIENSSYIATAKPMKVLPNTQYYVKSPYGVRFGECDINGIYTGNHYYVYAGSTFTTSSNCFYLLFYVDKAITNATYNNDICINLSHTGVENGKYEPYWDATKDLSVIQKYFPNGMRSAGSIYDEISFDETTQKWVAIQRVGNVDLGSLSWAYSEHLFGGETVAGFKTSIEDIIFANTATTLPNITVSKYNINTADKVANGYAATETFTGYKAYKTDLSAYFTFTTDASEFKSSLSGVMLNYELAEPIITVIEEPINLSYKVGDFGIEQILSDSFSAPFRADIIYQFNATDRIRENSLNIEKLSKTQKDYLPLTGGTMSGQLNSQDIKPIEDSTYQLGDSTHKYKNVFSDFFTGNLEGNAKTATVATDLSGRVEDTPEVFTYRPSAGEKSIKDDNAFIRRVKGNSIVWNQLFSPKKTDASFVQDGITFTDNRDGSYTINGTATADITKYNLFSGAANTEHLYFVHLPYRFSAIGYGESHTAITSPTSNNLLGTNIGMLYVKKGDVFDNVTVYPLLTDLTQMFGVGNEPTTVEEFRALYPDSYYPYNTGELRNLVCNGIKTVGFNQWDEQWEVGYLNADGTTAGYVQNYIRAKNYIPVISGEKYYAKLPNGVSDAQLYAVDENYNLIKQIYSWVNNQFFIPDGAAYIRFYLKYGSEVYNNDICINLHHTGYRDGEYEPYKEVTHSLPLSEITNGEPLRKAGSAYDEINETHYIKRVGVVDLGSLTYRKSDNFPNLFISNPFGAAGADADKIANLFCPKYIAMTAYDPWSDIISMGMDTSKQLYIYDPQYTDIAIFKSAMSGVMLYYELAEPIVTPIETPIDFNYYVEDFGTEEALLAEDSAPFSADIVYQFNATDQIRNNSRNIDKLQKSAFTPSGTSAQYIRGDGSYGDRFELSQSTPINDGEYEMPDAIHQFILTPNYYAKSPVNLDNSTTVTVCVTPPEDSNYLAEYWFEFAVDETLPNIEYYQPNNSGAVFRIDGDMTTSAVNILHLISSDGGTTFFGEIRSYSL